MMKALFGLAVLLAELCWGQTAGAGLTNASVSGRYFFRQLDFSTDAQGNITRSVGSLGTLQFDGAGRFTVDGFQTVDAQGATSLTGTGVYGVNASGTMTLSNPQRNDFMISARFGTEAILGSTTESADNTFDLFAAIPAPVTTQGVASLSGNYSVATFELQNGLTAGARSSLFGMQSSGTGFIGHIVATGHAANLSNGAILTQNVDGAAYAIGSDGAGTISFGGSSLLVSGTKNVYVSQSGNVFLGGSPYGGAQDFFIGVRQFVGTAPGASLTGLYWTAGLRLDLNVRGISTAAYAGSMRAAGAGSPAVTSQRYHQIGLSPGFDVTLANTPALNKDGSFAFALETLDLGLGGNSWVAAGLSSMDAGGYSIDIGIRAASLAGMGVYFNPQGVLNAASLSPVGAAVAPGEFVSIFGSGLAAAASGASPPYPFTLGGVSVTVNGLQAPLAYVSPNQLNVLIPYAVTGGSATIAVTNAGAISNSVALPLQKTAPGVFSGDGSGAGAGAITHANGSLVTAANPARRGETVVVYLAGLGVLTTPVADGMAGSGIVANAVSVSVAGQPLALGYAGLAPSFPGLYQLNVTIPANLVGSGALPLAVRTVDALHCQVDLPVQ